VKLYKGKTNIREDTMFDVYQKQVLYLLLASRSDFRLRFEKKVQQGASDPDEIAPPTPVNKTQGDKDYLVKRFVDTANSAFSLKIDLNQAIANGDPDVAAIESLYEQNATDIGYIKPDGTLAGSQKTNITREIGKINKALSPYPDNSPCPSKSDQQAIYDLYNSVIQPFRRIEGKLARTKAELH
jgi:hypothetical protein